MYSVFDSFLKTPYWYTIHPADEGRFWKALQMAVSKKGFNPDEMGRYMRENKNITLEDDNEYAKAIDSYVARAWAVKDYLEATSE